jgi:hypothetical protein
LNVISRNDHLQRAETMRSPCAWKGQAIPKIDDYSASRCDRAGYLLRKLYDESSFHQHARLQVDAISAAAWRVFAEVLLVNQIHFGDVAMDLL